MGLETLAALTIGILTKKTKISFEEASLLHGLLGSITGLFKRGERKCLHATHKCNYRDGACKVLEEKGSEWEICHIEQCPYRELSSE